MEKAPTTIIFDVNETLLDLAPLRVAIGDALNGEPNELASLWFSTTLHYSVVETVTGHYRSFPDIGIAALQMIAEGRGIELSREEASAVILETLVCLPPHQDVRSALEEFKASGVQLIALSNSSQQGLESQLAYTGLADLFAHRYSVESVRKFKPHPDVYRFVLEDLGVSGEETLMVASHAWDLAGAQNAGLQTAFLARPGCALYPPVERPDFVVENLHQLVSKFI